MLFFSHIWGTSVSGLLPGRALQVSSLCSLCLWLVFKVQSSYQMVNPGTKGHQARVLGVIYASLEVVDVKTFGNHCLNAPFKNSYGAKIAINVCTRQIYRFLTKSQHCKNRFSCLFKLPERWGCKFGVSVCALVTSGYSLCPCCCIETWDEIISGCLLHIRTHTGCIFIGWIDGGESHHHGYRKYLFVTGWQLSVEYVKYVWIDVWHYHYCFSHITLSCFYAN